MSQTVKAHTREKSSKPTQETQLRNPDFTSHSEARALVHVEYNAQSHAKSALGALVSQCVLWPRATPTGRPVTLAVHLASGRLWHPVASLRPPVVSWSAGLDAQRHVGSCGASNWRGLMEILVPIVVINWGLPLIDWFIDSSIWFIFSLSFRRSRWLT